MMGEDFCPVARVVCRASSRGGQGGSREGKAGHHRVCSASRGKIANSSEKRHDPMNRDAKRENDPGGLVDCQQ